jgi:putative heme-binding domain-containing protein
MCYAHSSRLAVELPCLILTFIITFCSAPIEAQEPKNAAAPPNSVSWSDERLSDRQGLLWWIDVEKQGLAWAQAQRSPLVLGQPMDVVYDASGWQRDARQDIERSFPKLESVAGKRTLHFDGQDDYLRSELDLSLSQLTLFMVASAESNQGLFRALLSASASSRNDYITGFNVDLGPTASNDWNFLNIEGAGFSGARKFVDNKLPLGRFQLLEVRIDAKEIRVTINGTGQQSFAKKDVPMQWLNAWLGSRYYSNVATPATVSGFWHGNIAEVLLYGAALDEQAQQQVRRYLLTKHHSLFTGAKESQAIHPLETLEKTPAVQMFLPGFRVRQLPLELTNINNLRYRDDGKLFALGYNGNVFILSDSDGDGLEDQAKLFWENKGRLRGPLGMFVAPQGYSRGAGVIVASKGKVSFLHDRDRDDVADEEQIVATGWKEIPQNVDAVGLAVGPDESIYFSLGTANYANGYLLDNDGRANFDLNSERGNILKIAPDWKSRQTVCRGVRFPVALDFNSAGDLFATDQEGATWLSNGNPFDELLHIQPEKYYGFPPSHPRHLPDVINEPSVFDYGPQHQSTCGLFFNRSVNGGPSFGPAAWSQSAFVCGESRGKIFRTEVVKTSLGYVAQNTLIAGLNQLTIDCTVTPKGGLLVACHSGPPDWGTGPEGKGSLYVIEYVDSSVPQPVYQWASGTNEINVAFDRELSDEYAGQLSQSIRLERGPYNAAGDRFEVLAPPYAVVQMQRENLRTDLPVLGVHLTPDRRNVRILTSPLNSTDRVSIVLPSMPSLFPATVADIEQVAGIDLACDATGVVANWRDLNGENEIETVIPHFDLELSRTLTQGSVDQSKLWHALGTPGRLTLEAVVDVSHLLQPRVQVGAKLDYEPVPEEGVLRIEALEEGVIRSVRLDETEIAVTKNSLTIPVPQNASHVRLRLELETRTNQHPQLQLSFSTRKSAEDRALALSRFSLPYIPEKPADGDQSLMAASEPWDEKIVAGSWLNGREIYYGVGQCAKCHTLRNLPGGSIGPDLSNLLHRDDKSILRDIRQPSATLNPDHLMLVARMSDGEVVQGVPLANENKATLLVGLADGSRRELPRSEIEELKSSPISLMPAGLMDALSPQQVADLMVFLKRNPLEPTTVVRDDQPPYRSWDEFNGLGFTADANKAPRLEKPFKVVLCDGPKDHGPEEHDYPEWKRRWLRLLGLVDNLSVESASEWPSDEQLASADLIVFYSANPQWEESKSAVLDRYLQRGGGLVFMHFAVNGRQAVEPLAVRIGLACDPKVIKYRHGPVKLKMSLGHPLTEGLPSIDVVDESYWKMTGDAAQIQWVASGEEDGANQPLIWTVERGKGRVFVSIMGHYSWTLDDPIYRVLLLRGMMWAGHRPDDGLLPLATIGARIRGNRENSAVSAKK